MHFAAQTHVDNSFGNSFAFTHNNVVGTHVLLEAAKIHMPTLRRFIHVSTDEVYGDVMGEGVVENAVFEPTNPYSCSKAAAEFIVKAYQRSYDLPVIITRGNNVSSYALAFLHATFLSNTPQANVDAHTLSQSQANTCTKLK
jgi:dTDP-D-glucose 4,6-dehydratase